MLAVPGFLEDPHAPGGLAERLGQALFERRHKQLVLTEAGRIALEHADAIFKAGEELVSTLKGRPYAARPVLRFSDGSVVAEHRELGEMVLACDGAHEILFTENESNAQRLWAQPNASPSRNGRPSTAARAASTDSPFCPCQAGFRAKRTAIGSRRSSRG